MIPPLATEFAGPYQTDAKVGIRLAEHLRYGSTVRAVAEYRDVEVNCSTVEPSFG